MFMYICIFSIQQCACLTIDDLWNFVDLKIQMIWKSSDMVKNSKSSQKRIMMTKRSIANTNSIDTEKLAKLYHCDDDCFVFISSDVSVNCSQAY